MVSQEGIGMPRAGVRGSSEPPSMGPPEEQQALLTPEPPRLRLRFYLCSARECLLCSVCPPCHSPASLSHWLFASMKHFYVPNTVEASLLARNADTNTNTVMYRFHEESYRSLSAAGNSCIELGMWLMCLPPGLRKLEQEDCSGPCPSLGYCWSNKIP